MSIYLYCPRAVHVIVIRLTSIVIPLQSVLGLLGILEVSHHFGFDDGLQDVNLCALEE